MAEIFNKEALEALDDHSEAKEMARVASPKVRIVIAAMVAMMVVVIYWCIFGTINYKVTAQGVVFPFGEATPISVPYDGAVSRLLVSHGATVANGVAVMEIRNALSTTAVRVPRDGVVIQTLPLGAQFKAGEPVRVYSVGGNLVATHYVESDGSLVIPISSLPSGISIIKTNQQTIKITRK